MIGLDALLIVWQSPHNVLPVEFTDSRRIGKKVDCVLKFICWSFICWEWKGENEYLSFESSLDNELWLLSHSKSSYDILELLDTTDSTCGGSGFPSLVGLISV